MRHAVNTPLRPETRAVHRGWGVLGLGQFGVVLHGLVLLGLMGASCLPPPREPPPPVTDIPIPPPLPEPGQGYGPPGTVSRAGPLPTQPVAPPAHAPEIDGRLLIATTRTGPRPHSDLSGDYRLAWLSRAGLQPVPLSGDDQGVVDAAARPDGGQVVAIVGGGKTLLSVADDGQAVSELLGGLSGADASRVESYLSLAWAGSDRLLVRQTPPAGLFYVDARGQSRVPLAIRGLDPAPSPDGKRLALGYDDGGQYYSIFVADEPFSTPTKLTADTVPEALPAWSPDGNWLAYAAAPNPQRGWEVRVVQADGTVEQTIVPSRSGVTYASLRWSPDGSRIAFTRQQEAAHIRQIGIVGRDGTGEALVSDSTANDKLLGWVN